MTDDVTPPDSDRGVEAVLEAVEHLETMSAAEEVFDAAQHAADALRALKRVELDDVAPESRERLAAATEQLEDIETAAVDEYPVLARAALAELAPVAARAARERRETLPAPGSAAVSEGSKPIRDELDVDLEAAEDPLAELRAALRETDRPPWRLTTLVDVDEAVIDAFRPAFEQAYADPDADLYDLLYNYGATDLTIALDGYDLDYYFEHRNAKMKERRRGERREDN